MFDLRLSICVYVATKKPAVSQLFNDVYDELPWHLKEQQADMQRYILIDHVSQHYTFLKTTLSIIFYYRHVEEHKDIYKLQELVVCLFLNTLVFFQPKHFDRTPWIHTAGHM